MSAFFGQALDMWEYFSVFRQALDMMTFLVWAPHLQAHMSKTEEDELVQFCSVWDSDFTMMWNKLQM